MMESTPTKPPMLYVALDDLSTKHDATIALARRLHQTGAPFGFKVNLDEVLTRGFADALAPFEPFNRPIFADLKIWNGKRTMSTTFQELDRLQVPVSYVTAYALAGSELAAAIWDADDLSLRVAGVTVLTHYTDEYCQLHFKRTAAETVVHFAGVGISAGCRALVLPGQHLPRVHTLLKELKLGPGSIHTIVPGIREACAMNDGRHAKGGDTTPEMARLLGASAIVCGSPIMRAADPEAALLRILRALEP